MRTVRGVGGFAVLMILASAAGVCAEVLTMDQCVDIALQRNVAMATARYSLENARQNVWSAWGEWLPQFSLSADYSYSEQGGVTQYQQRSPIQHIYGKSIGVEQQVFSGGQEWFNIKNKLYIRRSSEHNLTGSELETVELVKKSYFGALKAKGLLEVAEQVVAAAEQNLKLVQARFDLGSANQSELLKAKVQLLKNRSEFESARRNVAVSLAELNNAMNRPATAPLELDPMPDTLAVTVDFDGAIAYAERNHPQILAAEADLQASHYQRLWARGSYLPSVSWGASRSYSVGQDYMWDSFDDSYANWGFRLRFGWSIPFLDGFSRKTSNSKATAAYKLAQLQLEATINGVGLAVQTAILDINNARANLNLFEESLRSAEEDLQIAQERYKLGAATILDLLEAERNLGEARNNFVSAKFDFNLNVAALDRAMGKRR